MKRIKTSVLLSPATIYQHATVVAEGYKPSERARFAVVRTARDAPWRLVHIRSGVGCDSVLPALSRKLTMTDKLAVAAAFDAATYLDWRAFDALPECGPGVPAHPKLDAALNPPVNELRALAALAVPE